MTPFDMLADYLAHPLAQRLTWVLAHFCWQGAVVLALARAAESLLSLRRAQARYALYCGAMLLLSLCPPATYLLATGSEGRPAALLSAGELSTVVIPRQSPAGDSPGEAATPADNDAERSTNPQALLAAAQPWLLAAWLAGVAGMAVRLLVSVAGVHWIKRHRQPVSAALQRLAAQLAGRMRLGATVCVFTSGRVREAVVAGFVRPVVLIPAAWLLELPPESLEAIIAHELAHIRRCDVWINLLQRLVETLLFYHPAVWMLSRRIRLEREMCCDELAVAALGRRDVYVDALRQIAERRIRVPQPALSAAIRGGNSMTLLKRVRYLLDASAPAPRYAIWPAGLIALAGPAALLALVVAVAESGQGQQRDEREAPHESRRRDSGEAAGAARRESERERHRAADRRADHRREEDRERSAEDREHRERERDQEISDIRVRRLRDIEGATGLRAVRQLRDFDRERSQERLVLEKDDENRDEQLLRMIIELKNEISSLRRELREMRGVRERGERESADRRRDGEPIHQSERELDHWPDQRLRRSAESRGEEREPSFEVNSGDEFRIRVRREGDADRERPKDDEQSRESRRTLHIDGLVTAVEEGQLVEVSIGSDDGLRPRQRLNVFRGDEHLGVIEVVRVAPDQSAARIMSANALDAIRRGDRVATTVYREANALVDEENDEHDDD